MDAVKYLKTLDRMCHCECLKCEFRKDGVVMICPIAISASYRGKDGSCANPSDMCTDCMRKFWLAEVEDV